MSDFTAAETSTEGLKGEVTTVEPDRFARATARRSAESRATLPAVEYATVADASGLLTAIARYGSITPLLVKATATALTLHPRANAAYRDARYEMYGRINIGVTLSEGDTYVTPTVIDADTKSESQIAQELDSYLEVTRGGELHPSVFAGATFTVLAPTGHDAVITTPIIQTGQAAVLTAGPPRETAIVQGGAVTTGHTVELILAADHRILFGSGATAFLQEVKNQLQGAGA